MRNISKFIGFLILLMGSCNKQIDKFKENNYFGNDFESIEGWQKHPNVLRGIAHSGKYSCKLDSINNYTLGFNILLSDLKIDNPKSVIVSAELYKNRTDTPCKMIVEIRNESDSLIFWQDGSMGNPGEDENSWIHFERDFSLPTNLQPEYFFRVYGLYSGSGECYIDDIGIKFN